MGREGGSSPAGSLPSAPIRLANLPRDADEGEYLPAALEYSTSLALRAPGCCTLGYIASSIQVRRSICAVCTLYRVLRNSMEMWYMLCI